MIIFVGRYQINKKCKAFCYSAGNYLEEFRDDQETVEFLLALIDHETLILSFL